MIATSMAELMRERTRILEEKDQLSQCCLPGCNNCIVDMDKYIYIETQKIRKANLIIPASSVITATDHEKLFKLITDLRKT